MFGYEEELQAKISELKAENEKLKAQLPNIIRSEILSAFCWVSLIGEQFFERNKTVENLFDEYLKSK